MLDLDLVSLHSFSFDLQFLKASVSFISHIIALFTFFPVIVTYKVVCLFCDISLNARPPPNAPSCTFWLLVSFFSRYFRKHVCRRLVSKSPTHFIFHQMKKERLKSKTNLEAGWRGGGGINFSFEYSIVVHKRASQKVRARCIYAYQDSSP